MIVLCFTNSAHETNEGAEAWFPEQETLLVRRQSGGFNLIGRKEIRIGVSSKRGANLNWMFSIVVSTSMPVSQFTVDAEMLKLFMRKVYPEFARLTQFRRVLLQTSGNQSNFQSFRDFLCRFWGQPWKTHSMLILMKVIADSNCHYIFTLVQ